MNFYNDNDPPIAAWLQALVDGDQLAPGRVDSRSITELEPDDLTNATQVHLFAGIGGWPHALDLAGWPRTRPVWTFSCPCQPLSVAGQRQGAADERHLWPAVFELVAELRPPVLFGEQSASPLGMEWLAGVRLDLDALGYACGAADLSAASVGAPHIRQRLYFVARRLGDPDRSRPEALQRRESGELRDDRPIGLPSSGPSGPSAAIGLADLGRAEGRAAGRARDPQGLDLLHPRGQEGAASSLGGGTTGAGGLADPERDPGDEGRAATQPREGARTGRAGSHDELGRRGDVGGLAEPDGVNRGAGTSGRDRPQTGDHSADGGLGHPDGVGPRGRPSGQPAGTVAVPSPSWDDYRWIGFGDNKARRIESRIEPLALRVPNRVVKIRGYGNAIVPPLAAVFIRAAMDAID